MKSYIAGFVFLIAGTAQAVLLDLNVGFSQGGYSAASEQSSSAMFSSFGIFAKLGKADSGAGISMGWAAVSLSTKDEFQGTIEQTVKSNDTGPAIRWQFDEAQIFSLSYIYGLVCKGKSSNGVTEDTLEGDSQLIKFAIEPPLNRNFSIGFAINSYTANYKKIIINNLQSDVGYKNNWVYPSLSFAVHF